MFLRRYLERAPTPFFTLYVVGAAFSTYFCMYAFRKPFTVGTYDGSVNLGFELDYKTLFVISQIAGYATSKFIGIKVVSEMQPGRRAFGILVLIGAAEAALLLFGILPAPYSAAALVLNGLPLGMVWGLVFGFVEGRKTSDLLGAGLCASFIVASGFMKSVGRWVIESGVSEAWMPFVTGLIFVPPLLLSVFLLSQVPPPTEEDEALRTRRAPMDGPARWAFFRAHALGLFALVVGYVILSAYRDFRDNFARELWDALGYADQPSIMTTAEIPVAFGALLSVGAMIAIRNNRRALLAIHLVMLGGALLTTGSTLLFQLDLVSPAAWMISVGLGLYVAYVPFNCVLFDRMIAAIGSVATAGFVIYVSDAFGYAGSVSLLLFRSFARPNVTWVTFFTGLSHAAGLSMLALFALAAAYFWRQTRPG